MLHSNCSKMRKRNAHIESSKNLVPVENMIISCVRRILLFCITFRKVSVNFYSIYREIELMSKFKLINISYNRYFSIKRVVKYIRVLLGETKRCPSCSLIIKRL